ncbi:MAG: tetratricopeptide repeat protein [Planctomycetes bacterium]|nr:tetratricopeptide repeat protein [Planctomycetota bacterium]
MTASPRFLISDCRLRISAPAIPARRAPLRFQSTIRNQKSEILFLALALFAALQGCGKEEPPAAPRAPKAAPAVPSKQADATHVPLEHQLHDRLARNPGDLAALLALANHYYDTDRPHKAAVAYRQVLERKPDDPAVRTDLGTCYRNMGQLDLARAEYERVLAKHPNHVQATYNLAVVSHLAGDHLRAAELWEKAAALAPGSPAAKTALQNAAEARTAAAAKASPPGKQ